LQSAFVPNKKRGKMKESPCMKAELELYEATKKWIEAFENWNRLISQEPVGDQEERLKWQDEKAKAGALKASTHKDFKEKNDAFLNCMDENRPLI
jgi:hypothetical protein